jgi:hypothetical protein
MLVAHAYDPRANSLQNPVSRITRTKWTGGVVQVAEVPALQAQSPGFKH